MQPNDPLSVPESHLPAWVGWLVFTCAILYIAICFIVGATKGRRSDLGHMDTFIISLIATPLTGYLLAHAQRSKGGHTCKWCGHPNVTTQWCPGCGHDQRGNEVANVNPATEP